MTYKELQAEVERLRGELKDERDRYAVASDDRVALMAKVDRLETELSLLRVTPSQPAALVLYPANQWEAFEDAADADRWRSTHHPADPLVAVGPTLYRVERWTWHRKEQVEGS